jgi:cell division septum initiation protein DivIVA
VALIAFVLCILALGALQYLNKQQKAKLTAHPGNHETDKEAFALRVANAQQQEALAELRKATNLLEKLSGELDDLLKATATSPTNNAEAQTAASPELTNALRNLPTPREIRDRVSQIDPVIFRIESAQHSPYLPDPHLIADAKKTSEWASINLSLISELRARVGQMQTNGPAQSVASVPPPKSPPQPPEPTERSTNEVTHSAVLAEAKAEADRIIAETKAEAARILDETRAEAMRILSDARERAAAILAEIKAKSAVTEEAKPVQAATEDPATLPVAPEKTPNPSTNIVVAIEAPAREPDLQQVLSDPKLRARLRALTTPGTMRVPGMFRAEKAPISLSQLKQFGALEPDISGLDRLVEIASTPQDAIRPRWNFKIRRGVWQHRSAEVEEARRVQQVLIEHGSDLVAAGLLAE